MTQIHQRRFDFQQWNDAGRPSYDAQEAPGRVEDLKCGDCGSPMRLRNSRFGLFYGCVSYPECRGTMGAHAWGEPKGVPGDESTRRAREEAHAAFDRIWLRKLIRTRHRAYEWLAGKMGVSEIHIANLNIADCLKVVSLCDGFTGDDERT